MATSSSVYLLDLYRRSASARSLCIPSSVRVTMLATALLAATALAGCTGGGDVGPGSFRLALADAPEVVVVGKPVDMRVIASGSAAATTDHAGAHYWSDAPSDPTLAIGAALSCEHESAKTDLPGAFVATCTFTQSGDHYVHGHAKLDPDATTTYHYWSPVHRIVALDGESYLLTPSDIRNDIHPDDEPAFDLRIDGPAGVITEHVGGHFWDRSHDAPSENLASAHACSHEPAAVSLPSSISVSCKYPSSGTWYLRGHLRVVTDDGTQFDYWTHEHVIEVRQ